MLYHLLLPRGSEIPAAVFDVLMDFAVDTGVQRALRHPQAITLMLDLVIVATVSFLFFFWFFFVFSKVGAITLLYLIGPRAETLFEEPYPY